MADNTPAPAQTPPGTGDDYKELKDAIAKEREATKAAEKRAKDAEKSLTEVQERLAKLESDTQSDSEKAIEKARKEAATEAAGERDQFWSQKFVRAEVKAAAAQKLADPDDIRLLDLEEFTVAEDGSIQGDIGAAVDKLIESKPHLAARKGTRQTIDAGPQGGTAGESIDELFGRSITEQIK